MSGDDTIVAVATAPGLGALSIVRLSGGRAHEIAGGIMHAALPGAGRTALRALRTRAGELLDHAVVLRYDAPRSYTGEHAVEFVCHGGQATATRLMEALVELGARPAVGGEFTRRAVLNGKMDLLQAEAVNDLIRAGSTAGAHLALSQLDGGLSRRIEALRASILEVEALAAYEIDFPEEDDGPIDQTRILAASERTAAAIRELIATTPAGELIREGALVAIVGPPNVGKSSLFNALLGRKRALVADVPGTTRDAIEALLDVSPIPLRLVDTAGLRETEDPVEQLGIGVSRQYLEQAAAVLACGDSSATLRAAVSSAEGTARGKIFAVRTKSDVIQLGDDDQAETYRVSATTGQGLDRLIADVSKAVGRDAGLPSPDSPVVAHARYRNVLARAEEELRAFVHARADAKLPATVAAVHLRESVRILEEMIGGVDVDQVLARVFSSFCVGK